MEAGHDRADEGSIRPAARGFAETIHGIVSIVEGHSSSPKGLEDGLDYGFVIAFDQPAGARVLSQCST